MGLRLEQAIERLAWNPKRWQIDVQHAVLTSEGYGVERLPFRAAETLQRALALSHVVVWRTVDLVCQYRTNPEDPPVQLFTPDKWAVLALRVGHEVTTVQEAVRLVAKLGGDAGYPSSPPPGKQVVVHGLETLAAKVSKYRLIRDAEHRGRSDT